MNLNSYLSHNRLLKIIGDPLHLGLTNTLKVDLPEFNNWISFFNTWELSLNTVLWTPSRDFTKAPRSLLFCGIIARNAESLFLPKKFNLPFSKRSFSHVVPPLRLQFLFTYFNKYWLVKSVKKLVAMLLCGLLKELQILLFFLHAGLFWNHALILILNLSEKMALVVSSALLAVFITDLIWFGSTPFFFPLKYCITVFLGIFFNMLIVGLEAVVKTSLSRQSYQHIRNSRKGKHSNGFSLYNPYAVKSHLKYMYHSMETQIFSIMTKLSSCV